MYSKLLFVILAATFTLGCQQGQHEDLTLGKTQTVPIIAQHAGSDEALAELGAYLINDKADLDAMGSSSLAAITIDFDNQSAVLITLGQRDTGGYGVTITGAQQAGSDLYVQGVTSTPAEGDAVTEAVTYPFVLAVIPKTHATLHPEID